jgi:isopenicillin-N epimerase
VQARQVLCEQLNVEPACPDHLLGSMAAIPLADGDADRLHRQLLDQAQIEVPVFPWPQPPRRWLRISAQQYNAIRDYEYLAQRLTAMLTAQVIS